MTQVRIYQMDAFTHIPFGGNPAGVVSNADGLTVEQMQKVAREMNCSETAFVLSTDTPGADIRVRFFTPTEEIDLCGHATISTFVVLGMENRFERDLPLTIVQETNVGLLPVTITRDAHGRIQALMTQATPCFRECPITPAEAAKLIGLSTADIDPNLPIGLAYTGLWDLMIPIKSVEAFEWMRPDQHAISTHNRALGIASTHCYSLETLQPTSHLHTRDFSPAFGIPEDPATGTANGALGAFMLHHGVFTPQQEQLRLIVEQGFEIGRPSFITVEVDGEVNSPRTVRVGGHAVPIIQGTMTF